MFTLNTSVVCAHVFFAILMHFMEVGGGAKVLRKCRGISRALYPVTYIFFLIQCLEREASITAKK